MLTRKMGKEGGQGEHRHVISRSGEAITTNCYTPLYLYLYLYRPKASRCVGLLVP